MRYGILRYKVLLPTYKNWHHAFVFGVGVNDSEVLAQIHRKTRLIANYIDIQFDSTIQVFDRIYPNTSIECESIGDNLKRYAHFESPDELKEELNMSTADFYKCIS